MYLKKHIPNAITCGNLFCGCLAAVFAFQGNLVWAAYLVGIGAVLDFFDGLAARLLHVHSEIGKQLDSLADMVTFGFVPGLVMYQLLTVCVLRNTISHFDLGNFLSGVSFAICRISANDFFCHTPGQIQCRLAANRFVYWRSYTCKHHFDLLLTPYT
jgi:phosphatidylserine synthase